MTKCFTETRFYESRKYLNIGFCIRIIMKWLWNCLIKNQFVCNVELNTRIVIASKNLRIGGKEHSSILLISISYKHRLLLKCFTHKHILINVLYLKDIRILRSYVTIVWRWILIVRVKFELHLKYGLYVTVKYQN
jgi:hypothetical protein